MIALIKRIVLYRRMRSNKYINDDSLCTCLRYDFPLRGENDCTNRLWSDLVVQLWHS